MKNDQAATLSSVVVSSSVTWWMFAGSLSGRTTRCGSRSMISGGGALWMIAAALEAEVDEYIASFVDERDEDAKRLVVRNGKA